MLFREKPAGRFPAADKAADAFQVVRRLGKPLAVVVAKSLQDIRLVDVVGNRLPQIFQPQLVAQGGD